MLRYLYCFFLVIAFGCAEAQIDLDNAVSFQNTESLNSTLIKKLVEGPFGFIWIATGDGLYRFDGSLLHAVFDGTFEDIDIDEVNSQLVFTSRSNVIIRSFSGDKAVIVPIDSLVKGDYILESMTITNDSSYWFASTYGIIHFNHKTGTVKSFQIFKPDHVPVEVTAISHDPQNNELLWLGTKSGLYSFNMLTDKYERHWLKNALRSDRELELNSFDALYVHTDGKIYCGSWGAGLAIYDPLTGEIDQFVSDLGKRDFPHVYAIVPESDSIIWISTTTGCGKYHVNTGIMQSYIHSSVIDDIVLDIGPVMIDKKDRYWIGYINGLRMLDPSKSQIEVVECPIMTNDKFYIPRGVTIGHNPDLLYLTVQYSDGLYTYNLKNKEWNCIMVNDPDPDWNFEAWDTYWQADTLWILEAEGLYYYVEGSQYLNKYPMAQDNDRYRFTSFAWIARDEVWFASKQKGLYTMNTKHGVLKHYSQIDALSRHDFLENLNLLQRDRDGRIWLSRKNHLYLYLPEESVFKDFSAQVNHGLPFMDVYSITEDANHIWLSTSSGVYKIQYHEGDHLNSVQVADISSNSAISDGKEYLWIATASSIIRVNVQNHSSQIFTETSGLPNPGRHGYDKIDIIRDNQIFLAGRKYFALFNSSELNITPEAPTPYFVNASVDGIQTPLSGLGLSLNYLSIHPDQNSISIDFSAISYSSQINNHFRYRLEGANDDWIASSGQGNGPTYVNLNAGEYRFLVEVGSDDEGWSAPAILEISVGEYWWQKSWVHLLLALAGIGALIAVYQFRLNRIRKNSEVQLQIMNLEKKALQAQMNPHFIFNAMNSIQHFMANKDEKNAMFYLNRFGKILRSILDNSSKSFVTLKSELEMLENYIMLESLRFEDAFEYKIDVDRSLDYNDIKIPGFIIQPVVENAIKHGLLPKDGGGMLHITLKQSEGMVNCIVEDNGVGRNNEGSTHKNDERISMGLTILRSRLKMYNAPSSEEVLVIEDLHSDDGSPSGTRVMIKLPIQTD